MPERWYSGGAISRAQGAALMLLRRFQAERDGPGEVVSIHAAGQCVLHVLQRLIACAPRVGDGFDLDVTFGFDAAENDRLMLLTT